MLRSPRFLHLFVEAQVRNHAMHGPQLSTLNYLPDLDAEGEIPRPDRFHEEKVLFLRQLDQLLRLRRVHRKGFLAQHVLAGFEAQHRVLIVVGVGGRNVDDVDVPVGHELGVGAVCNSGGGTFRVLQELLGTVCRAGRCGSDNGMSDVGYIACGRVDEKIFGESYGAEEGQLMYEAGVGQTYSEQCLQLLCMCQP